MDVMAVEHNEHENAKFMKREKNKRNKVNIWTLNPLSPCQTNYLINSPESTTIPSIEMINHNKYFPEEIRVIINRKNMISVYFVK
jgi:hypothetical protein